MTFEAPQDNEATTVSPCELPLRNGRIVRPAEAELIDREQAAADKAAAYLAEAEKQLGFVSDGGTIAENLKNLAGLFQHGLLAKDDGGDLVGYGFVLVDCMQTMAARLAALEEQARESLAQCQLLVSR